MVCYGINRSIPLSPQKQRKWEPNGSHLRYYLFVVINYSVHEVHHRLGSTEHAFHLV